MKKLILFFLLVIFLCGCEQNIGGQRDEYGCLGPAGYSYDSDVAACVRVWELDENQKKAAALAVDYIEPEDALTIINVETARCPGCFLVEVEKGKNRYKINIENWIVKDRFLMPEECDEAGGRLVNTVAGASCAWNEEFYGNVSGFISPNICCVKIYETGFCGWDTGTSCVSDSECISGGCSNHVCSGLGEQIMTTCEWTECYDANKYGVECLCVDDKCQWS